jgi:hypothetical protein
MSKHNNLDTANNSYEISEQNNNSKMLKEDSINSDLDNLEYSRNIPKPRSIPISRNMAVEIERNELMRIDSCEKITLFTNHICGKINYLDDSQLFLEFKLLNTKDKFRRLNFIVLTNTVILTFIEIIYKQFDVVNSSYVIGDFTKNMLLLLPFVSTSIITLLSAWIKSLKFEEVIENITRGIEKSITAKSKLSKITEDIYIIKLNIDGNINTKMNELISTKYNCAFKDYLDAITIIDKNWNAKDCQQFLSDYLKTKKNEIDIEMGKKNINLTKYQKHIENKRKELEYKEIDMELDNILKELELKNIDKNIELKLKKKEMDKINKSLDNEEIRKDDYEDGEEY